MDRVLEHPQERPVLKHCHRAARESEQRWRHLALENIQIIHLEPQPSDHLRTVKVPTHTCLFTDPLSAGVSGSRILVGIA